MNANTISQFISRIHTSKLRITIIFKHCNFHIAVKHPGDEKNNKKKNYSNITNELPNSGSKQKKAIKEEKSFLLFKNKILQQPLPSAT